MSYLPFPPLGQVAKANSVPVTVASDDDLQSKLGIVTETAPASDTASAGLNGRLQRVAQRLTSLITLVPTSLGTTTASGSLSITLASDDGIQTKLGVVTEAAPASDTASSGLNGRLQRIAQRLTSLITLVPTALGTTTAAGSFSVTLASDDGVQSKLGIVTETAPASDTTSSGLNGRLQRVAQRLTSLIAQIPVALGTTTAAGSLSITLASDDGVQSKLGIVTETAPASDTASSGLNGRLQRIAQRLSSLIALVPSSLGQKTSAGSFSVTISSDDTINGAVTETAPASDTASSGLNGRLQRIAQRLSSLIALVPSSLGQKTAAGSFSVTMASDDAINGALTETAPASDTASSGLNGRLQRIAQRLTSLIALVPSSLGQKTAAGSFSVTIASDDVVSTRTAPSSTTSVSNVASAAADTSLLASNANRKQAIVFNESTSVLYLLFGSGAASATVYSVQIPVQSGYSLDLGQGGVYTGAIRGFWATANGFARITEFT